MAEQQQITIKVSDEDVKGRYANGLQISHQPEEFFLDFVIIAPPGAQLVSRIITSPGHMKRIAAAIDQQLKMYEKNFGHVEEADAPDEGIGFRR